MDFAYLSVLERIEEHLDPDRSESASFLLWYLENYFRLDRLEAVDAICDQAGDKGIDGIWVDDHAQNIYVFQARLSQKSDRTVGDSSLREFAGTLQQFNDKESVVQLVSSAGDAEVAGLIRRLKLVEKVQEYEVVGEYLTNIPIDSNGKAFLDSFSQITFVGPDYLETRFISDERNVPVRKDVEFDVAAFQFTEYVVDTQNRALIAPIRARDLLKLDGIQDQSIFTFNVRGPLGSTKVNKDMGKSVRDSSLHKSFPLFHNGVTIIANEMEVTNGKLRIANYFVVNGCQSLITLENNKDSITENLHVLAKFVQVDPSSQLAEQITEYSNNQNGVKPRDFKANSGTQIRLKNEFLEHYADQYAYSIKRGEPAEQGEAIANEDAGLYLMAFDLKEPWATHRKYQVFDDKHAALFARPEVTADRIVMLHIIREEIDRITKEQSENRLFWKYLLTRYLMLYLVSEILESDEQGRQIINVPENVMRCESGRSRFRKCMRTLLGDLVVDLNHEAKDEGENFDYRGKLRDEKWVKNLCKEVAVDHQKLVIRGRVESFADEWKSYGQNSDS